MFEAGEIHKIRGFKIECRAVLPKEQLKAPASKQETQKPVEPKNKDPLAHLDLLGDSKESPKLSLGTSSNTPQKRLKFTGQTFKLNDTLNETTHTDKEDTDTRKRSSFNFLGSSFLTDKTTDTSFFGKRDNSNERNLGMVAGLTNILGPQVYDKLEKERPSSEEKTNKSSEQVPLNQKESDWMKQIDCEETELFTSKTTLQNLNEVNPQESSSQGLPVLPVEEEKELKDSPPPDVVQKLSNSAEQEESYPEDTSAINFTKKPIEKT